MHTKAGRRCWAQVRTVAGKALGEASHRVGVREGLRDHICRVACREGTLRERCGVCDMVCGRGEVAIACRAPATAARWAPTRLSGRAILWRGSRCATVSTCDMMGAHNVGSSPCPSFLSEEWGCGREGELQLNAAAGCSLQRVPCRAVPCTCTVERCALGGGDCGVRTMEQFACTHTML